MDIEAFVSELRKEADDALEVVLKGMAIELWTDESEERFWLVADEADAALLGEPRGTVYTASEARMLVRITNPADVAEIHRWKRMFNGTVRDVAGREMV